MAKGLGDEWEVAQAPPYPVPELVESCLKGGVRYAALNPPTRLTRGTEPDHLR